MVADIDLAIIGIEFFLFLTGIFMLIYVSLTQHELLKLLRSLCGCFAVRATLSLTPNHSHFRRNHPMPLSLAPGKTATAKLHEFAASGNELPVAGPVSFTSSDSAVATVDDSGLVTAVAVGSATITGTDSANGLSASDSLTVAEVADHATLELVANA